MSQNHDDGHQSRRSRRAVLTLAMGAGAGAIAAAPVGVYARDVLVQGATGPAGPAGPVGPTGPRGATGPTGARGSTGAAGATGLSGTNGTPGATGATGPTGPIGVPVFRGFERLIPTGMSSDTGHFECESGELLISGGVGWGIQGTPDGWTIVANIPFSTGNVNGQPLTSWLVEVDGPPLAYQAAYFVSLSCLPVT